MSRKPRALTRSRAFGVTLVASMVLSCLGVAIATASLTHGRTYVGPLPAPSGWPKAKAALFRKEDNARLRATMVPMTAPSSAQSPTGDNNPGILPLADGGPFNSGQFIGTNLWNGQVNDTWDVVQAGGVPQDPSEGAAGPVSAAVFVYTRSMDPNSAATTGVVGVIEPASDPSGFFTVQSISSDGSTLTLTTATGATYTFNVMTNTFGG